MRLIFHPEARAEWLHDIDYYAEQRRGLGIRFADVIEQTIRHILSNPGRGRIVEVMCGGA
jgi:hypothetical protein